MTTKVRVPISVRELEEDTESGKGSESILEARFPDACIYCGAAAETHSDLNLTYKPAPKAKDKKESLSLPYCSQHEQINKRVSTIDGLAYGTVGVLSLLIVILATIGMGKEGSTEGGWLVCFFCGGFVLYLLLGILAWMAIRAGVAVFWEPFRHTPAFGGSYGFQPRYREKEHALFFSFANDEYARTFLQMNSGAAAEFQYENETTGLRWLANSIRRNSFVLEMSVWAVLVVLLGVLGLATGVLSTEAAAEGDAIDLGPVGSVLIVIFIVLATSFIVTSLGLIWQRDTTSRLVLLVASFGTLLVPIILADVVRILIVKRLYCGEGALKNAIIPMPGDSEY